MLIQRRCVRLSTLQVATLLSEGLFFCFSVRGEHVTQTAEAVGPSLQGREGESKQRDVYLKDCLPYELGKQGDSIADVDRDTA